MKIDRISYQKTFTTGPYQNERIGIEVQLEEGEDPGTVYKAAKEKVHEWQAEVSQLSQFVPGTDFPPGMKTEVTLEPSAEVISDKNREDQEILTGIETAESLEALRGYKRLANLSRGLTAAYKKREQELTNK